MTGDEFLPQWKHVKRAIDQIPHDSPTLDEILDQVEKDALAANKTLKKNWREITKMNIPIWIAAN
jgi:hypothetical protein